MSELPASRKFRYEMSELLTKLKTKEITEEEFSLQRDALFDQEALAQEMMGPVLIVKQLQQIETEVAEAVNQRFQKEEQEESERVTREKFAKAAEKKRIEREEQAKQKAIEDENNRRIVERDMFRSTLDEYIHRQEQNTNSWQRRGNWLQIILIVLTTATASMAGADGISRIYVVIVGFAAATLGGVLSYFQLQDKIYASRKALANLRLECQMYDYCLDDYQDCRADPEGAYLRFSKKVTAIQAEQMLYEVELLNPKRQETASTTQTKTQAGQKRDEEQGTEKDPSDNSQKDEAKEK